MRTLLATALLVSLAACKKEPPKKPEPLRPGDPGTPGYVKPGPDLGAPPPHQDPHEGIETSGTFEGRVNPELLQSAFRGRQAELQGCYESAKRRNKYLEGELSVRVEITPAGSPADLFIQRSTFGDNELERCFAEQVAQVRFPKPQGGSVLAEYPFAYHPSALLPGAGAPLESEQDAYLSKAEAALAACKDLPEVFSAAVWIDAEGKATSAGYGAPTPEGQSARACVVKSLGAAKYPKSKRKQTWLVVRDTAAQ